MIGGIEVSDHRCGATTVVAVSGELDMATAPCLGDHLGGLIEAGAVEVTVDLARLDFIDSTGLHVLISALKRLRANGGDLVLRGVTTRATKVFGHGAGRHLPPHRQSRVPRSDPFRRGDGGIRPRTDVARPLRIGGGPYAPSLCATTPVFEERAIIQPSPSQPGGQLMAAFTIFGDGLGDPVAVVGDFNDWDPAATVMSKNGDTRHPFRYPAAGKHWFNDEADDDYQPNDFGGCGSVLDLTSP